MQSDSRKFMSPTADCRQLPSLRQLKAARCVSDHGNLTRAAEALNRSQSAVTKALNDLESQLGTRLFDRTARGVYPTAPGEVMIERVRQVEAEFAAADKAWQAARHGRTGGAANPVFSLDISHKRLAAFIAVYEARDVGLAAARLDVSRTSINASLRELERRLELPLFENRSQRLAPSNFAHTLATHAKLAFSLIRHGMDDIASLEGVTRGRVAIGTLPYSRTLLTPRTIHRVLADHPQLQIATQEGPYSLLETSLRNGDLDLIIGATRDLESASALVAERLFEDKLAVIAREGHPLGDQRRLELHSLMDYGWVLPVRHTPARQLFDRYLASLGIEPPSQVVETSSLSTVRGLLLESDRIALLSGHQVYYDERAGLLQTLPIDLEGTYRPIGITLRRHTTPSPAARLFLDYLRRCAAEIRGMESIEPSLI